jgi:hypothetical protein
MTDTPPATRASAPGWRDPRLWVGVAIVAASVVAGALVLGSSDDTRPVWAAADTMGAGHVLTSDDLTVRRVKFADDSDEALYFTADQQLPAHLHLLRGIGAGELLPHAAVGSADAQRLRQVPISVAANQVPTEVTDGSVVDVYLRPSAHAACHASPACDGSPVLSGVTVLDAPALDQEFGSNGQRMLVLGMSEADARTFFRELTTSDDPSLTVVGRG